MKFPIIVLLASLFLMNACQPPPESELKKALTFHSSFDEGTTADFALGDKSMYTAVTRKNLEEAQAGMLNGDHQITTGGKWGSAFQFGKKSDTVIFYRSKDNISYNAENWSGTVSFWLSLDPATDLEPGYTDPVQITDVNYNDAAIWVDFTNENPRTFRLGVFGDLATWIQDTLSAPYSEVFDRRLVSVENPPFQKGAWTHIAITYLSLGTDEGNHNLYLNGKLIGAVSGIDDPFTWDLEKSNIFLGLNFTGLMDELSIFNKPLSAAEVTELYQLDGGVKSILK